MKFKRSLWTLVCLVSVILGQIDIQLRANWEKPPFELRLLETVASENQSLYLKTLAKVGCFALDDEDDEPLCFQTDQDLYDAVFDDLDSLERSLYDIPLANKLYSPRIIAHYKYYNEQVLPDFSSKLTKKCGSVPQTWVQYNDVIYCDPDDIYALMTDNKVSEEPLPFDRVIGNKGPLLVLYGDAEDDLFKPFIWALYQSSKQDKLRFVWRYVPRGTDEKELLAGYGVDLTLKRTDYIVIDDRDVNRGDQRVLLSEKTAMNSVSFLDSNDDDIKAISKDDLGELDLKIASFALSSDNSTENLENLIKIMGDLPRFSSYLSRQEVNEDLLEQLGHNAKVGLTSDSNGIFLNGLPIDEEKQNVFSLYKEIKKELKLVKNFLKLGITPVDAKSYIGKFSLLSLYKNRRLTTTRYNLGSLENNPVVFFNDVENDPIYEDYSDDASVYMQRSQFGEIPKMKSNLQTVIMAIDLTDEHHVDVLSNVLGTVTKRKIAQRIGVIPLASTEGDRILANNFYHVAETSGAKKALKYLRKLGAETPKSLTESDYVSKYVLPFVKTFDVKAPSIIVNGVFHEFDDNWPYSLTRQVSEDVRLIMGIGFQAKIFDPSEIKDLLYDDALTLRNNLLVPETQGLAKHRVLTPEFLEGLKESSNKVFTFNNGQTSPESAFTFTLGGDFGKKSVLEQFVEVLRFVKQSPANLKVRIIDSSEEASFWAKIRQSINTSIDHSIDVVENILSEHQFTTSQGRNKRIESLLTSIDVLADSFILLDGRYVDVTNELVTAQSLQFFLDYEIRTRLSSVKSLLRNAEIPETFDEREWVEIFSSTVTKTYFSENKGFTSLVIPRYDLTSLKTDYAIKFGDREKSYISLVLAIDPAEEVSQKLLSLVHSVKDLSFVSIDILLVPKNELDELHVKRFYRGNFPSRVEFTEDGYLSETDFIKFENVPKNTLFTLDMDVPPSWIVIPKESPSDLDNVLLKQSGPVMGIYELENLIIEGNAFDARTHEPPTGLAVQIENSDTYVMTNYGYLQLKANPGLWNFAIKESTRSSEIYSLQSVDSLKSSDMEPKKQIQLSILDMEGLHIYPKVSKKPGKELETLIVPEEEADSDKEHSVEKGGFLAKWLPKKKDEPKHADINIFTIASGHLYERLLSIMTASVMNHTKHTVKFWLIDNYMSPSFREFLPHLADKYGFEYELITYKWPSWLRGQREKQRTIWGYKILFLDVLFPQDLDKVIFVDADQIVRTDMKELVDLDLQGAPYGYTPMGDSRKEMEGFRFWKQGYWEKFLGDELRYHISALYVIDLKKFRTIAAGDKLRQHYQALSKDPGSLSNLDQDLPNNLQMQIKIFSLPQDWLWCETWCDDESLKTAKTIDLCNNPLTKEPKLDRARRQIPEWSVYDDEIAALRDKVMSSREDEQVVIDREIENAYAEKQEEKEEEKVNLRDEL